MESILDLPAKILINIFLYLNRFDFLRMRLVCRRFLVLSTDKRFKIEFEKSFTLQKLLESLQFKRILKNVSKLELKASEPFCSKNHLRPLTLTYCNLSELRLSLLTVEEGICVDDLPSSLRRLHLYCVTFESDFDFFMSNTKSSKLEELVIEWTNLSCFGPLRCFDSSLKLLDLSFIKNFSQLHFGLLKGKFPVLETLKIRTNDSTEGVTKIVSTFKKLKHLELNSYGSIKMKQALGFQHLVGLDHLLTLEITSLFLREDVHKMPIFPSLKTAKVCFLSYENEFLIHDSQTFPVLTRLELSETGKIRDLPFAILESLGSHPTLVTLSLNNFRILVPVKVNPVVVRPSTQLKSFFLCRCFISYEAAPLIARSFPNLTKVIISLDFYQSDSVKGDQADCIAEMLRNMKKLKWVKFSGVEITDAFLNKVVLALPDSVQEMSLDDGDIHKYETAFGNRSMKLIAENVPSLTTLKVNSVNVSGDGFFHLFKLKNLVELEFNGKKIARDQLEIFKRIPFSEE